MIIRNLGRAAGLALLSLVASPGQAADIPTPESVIGFKVGADRKLADWTQIVDYFRKLDAASARVKVDGEGKTTLGKPFLSVVITSEANMGNLEAIRQATSASPTRAVFRMTRRGN